MIDVDAYFGHYYPGLDCSDPSEDTGNRKGELQDEVCRAVDLDKVDI